MGEEIIRIIRGSPISREDFLAFLDNPFPELVKFVVDIEEEIIALGGELHSDAEEILLEEGSEQRNLWGGTIYPELDTENRLEFSALMNIRPSQENRSMEVLDEEVRNRMKLIIERLIPVKELQRPPEEQEEKQNDDIP